MIDLPFCEVNNKLELVVTASPKLVPPPFLTFMFFIFSDRLK